MVRVDNYRQVIPTAENLQVALSYFKDLYGSDDEVFTAYYLGELKK